MLTLLDDYWNNDAVRK